jgi:Zn-dependent protease with chaperone function
MLKCPKCRTPILVQQQTIQKTRQGPDVMGRRSSDSKRQSDDGQQKSSSQGRSRPKVDQNQIQASRSTEPPQDQSSLLDPSLPAFPNSPDQAGLFDDNVFDAACLENDSAALFSGPAPVSRNSNATTNIAEVDNSDFFDDLPPIQYQPPTSQYLASQQQFEVPTGSLTSGFATTNSSQPPADARLRNAAAISPAQVQHVMNDITKQLSIKVRKHPAGPAFLIGMILTAGFVLILPIVYASVVVAVTGAFLYCVGYLLPIAVMNADLMLSKVAIVVVALFPISLTLPFVILLIKPLFFSVIGSGDPRRRALRKESEPLLFHLVEKICEATGAPTPDRIEVDFQANASASFGSGWRAIFGRELTLTIGVPLLSSLNAKQFAGVLAHEFGHFAQGSSMRISGVIRTINAWFAKLVYYRDGIDLYFEREVEDNDTILAGPCLIGLWAINFIRRVMWCFMMLAHAASCYLMKQMEYDADRYEVELCGTASFHDTCRSLRLLSAAEAKSMDGLIHLIMEAVMIDNIPLLVEQIRDTIPEDEKQKILLEIATEKSPFFSTHPVDRARIKAAEKLNTKGVFELSFPASFFIRHYEQLCMNVTQDFYRNQLDRLVATSELQPTAKHLPTIQRFQKDLRELEKQKKHRRRYY